MAHPADNARHNGLTASEVLQRRTTSTRQEQQIDVAFQGSVMREKPTYAEAFGMENWCHQED
jgi:hypothetical protein